MHHLTCKTHMSHHPVRYASAKGHKFCNHLKNLLEFMVMYSGSCASHGFSGGVQMARSKSWNERRCVLEILTEFAWPSYTSTCISCAPTSQGEGSYVLFRETKLAMSVSLHVMQQQTSAQHAVRHLKAALQPTWQ